MSRIVSGYHSLHCPTYCAWPSNRQVMSAAVCCCRPQRPIKLNIYKFFGRPSRRVRHCVVQSIEWHSRFLLPLRPIQISTRDYTLRTRCQKILAKPLLWVARQRHRLAINCFFLPHQCHSRSTIDLLSFSCASWQVIVYKLLFLVLPCTDASTSKLLGIWPTTAHCFQPASAFSQQSPGFRSTLPAQHVRPSGFFCCWSDGLELTAGWSGVFCGQLQTVTEDIFIFAVLVCSAHWRFATITRYINLLLTLTLTLTLRYWE